MSTATQSPTVFMVGPVDLDAVLPLRWKILRPGLPKESAYFSGDNAPSTEHWAAMDASGKVVSVASIYEAMLSLGRHSVLASAARHWQLRGMATDAEFQGKGSGGELLKGVIRALSSRDSNAVFWCNARERAVRFYERHGFQVTSERFEIPGVGPHYVMQLSLKDTASQARQSRSESASTSPDVRTVLV